MTNTWVFVFDAPVAAAPRLARSRATNPDTGNQPTLTRSGRSATCADAKRRRRVCVPYALVSAVPQAQPRPDQRLVSGQRPWTVPRFATLPGRHPALMRPASLTVDHQNVVCLPHEW